MKRKWLVLLLLSLALCSGCSNIKKNNEESREPQEDKTIETVVKDVSGTKRDLKIDFVQNVGTEIKFLNIATDYSQVENGHYYYMRQMKKNLFTIYQDTGEKVGSFKRTDSDYYDTWYGFIRYNEQFYLSFSNIMDGKTKIAVVDFQEEKTKTICTISTEEKPDRIILYDNEIYCMYANDWEKYRVEKYDMAGNELETFFFSKPAENEYMEFINIAEGKIYYMIGTDKGNKYKVTFRCMDMETEKDEQVFSYCHSEGFSERNYLMMQGKEIYCWQKYFIDEYSRVMKLYVLPSTGGEMESIGNEEIYDFAYNTDYYFYVDRKHKLHRINRKTKKDNVISDIKVTEVKCTEDGLYVKEYDSWFDNGGFEWAYMDYSRTLYFMDFDGENVKRIAKGKRGHIY